MHIHILTDEKPNSGGIWTSVILIQSMLKELSVNVSMTDQFQSADIVWVHEFSQNKTLINIIKKYKSQNTQVWFHIHDYRHFCLTGRKYYSSPPIYCHHKLSLKCFFRQIFFGCGKGRNPIKMTKRFLSNKSFIRLFKKADRITVYSNYLKNQLVNNQISKSKVQLIGPYFKIYANNKPLVVSTNERVSLVWSSRFVESKGIKDFLEILRKLSDENFPFTAKIIGHGELEAFVKNFIQEYNLSAQVKLSGWLEQEKLGPIYDHSDLFIFNPIWPEPLGMAGLEAMSAGVHIITNGNGGSIEWASRFPKEVTLAKTQEEIIQKIKLFKQETYSKIDHGFYSKSLNDLKNILPALQRLSSK